MIQGTYLERLHEQLEGILPSKDAKAIIEEYQQMLFHFRLNNPQGFAVHAGRFVEKMFQTTCNILGENPQQTKVVKRIHDYLISRYKDDVRVRTLADVLYYGMYTFRSAKDAVHISREKLTIIDMWLMLISATWALNELVKIATGEDSLKTNPLELVKELFIVPYVEALSSGKVVVLRKLGCTDEILLLLASKRRMRKRQIYEEMGRFYAKSTIASSIKRLVKERLIVEVDSDEYELTSKGYQHIVQIVLSEEGAANCPKKAL